jgi:hypothetical protein
VGDGSVQSLSFVGLAGCLLPNAAAASLSHCLESEAEVLQDISVLTLIYISRPLEKETSRHRGRLNATCAADVRYDRL